MSQDDQNRNRPGEDKANQGQGWQDDPMSREGRSSDVGQDQGGATRDQAEGEDMDEVDEMEDDDRDEDSRPEGGPNRRRSIS